MTKHNSASASSGSSSSEFNTNHRSSSEAVEVIVLGRLDQPIKNEHPSYSARTVNLTGAALVLTVLFITPLPFGSAHLGTQLIFQSILLILAAIFFLQQGRQTSTHSPNLALDFPNRSLWRSGSYCLLLAGFLVILGSLLSGDLSSSYPINDIRSRNGVLSSILLSAIGALTFFGIAITAFFYSGLTPQRIPQIWRWQLFSFSMIAAISLMHWFYDNGRLFWYFEPQAVFTSNRARWPFVNADHLGHFLLLGLFLPLAATHEQIKRLIVVIGERRVHRAVEVLGLRRVQHSLVTIALCMLSFLTMVIAIAASLSRAAWLGGSIGLLLYLVLRGFDSSRSQTTSPNQNTSAARIRGRQHHLNHETGIKYSALFSKHAEKLGRFTLMTIGLVAIIFLLSGRGLKLISGRIDYSLAYSMEDIRWSMYGDTLEMIKEHPWLGVGWGNWSAYFGEVRRSELAGLNPVYLHSDPLQFIAEAGLPAGLLLLSAVGLFGFAIIRRLTQRSLSNPEDTQPGSTGRSKALPVSHHARSSALFCGLISFLIASAFDFPWRIPAITWTVAVCIGALLATLSNWTRSERRI